VANLQMPANWWSWTDEQLAAEIERRRDLVYQNSRRTGQVFKYWARLDSARVQVLHREQLRRQAQSS
jgi:hypothetical protein